MFIKSGAKPWPWHRIIQMMAADEHLLLQRTLQNLDYHEIFDDKSIPLLKKLLLDMKVLSEHANELQRENSILRSKNTTAGSNEDSNETYILDVVNMANDKIENLTRDLNLLRRENADLKSRDFEKSFKVKYTSCFFWHSSYFSIRMKLNNLMMQ